MSSFAPLARISTLVCRARGARLHFRTLAGAVALAAAAGCGAITEADEDPVADLAGSYVLTHHNDDPVPTITDVAPGMVEELLAGDIVLAVGADSTFAMALVTKSSFAETRTSQTFMDFFEGSFSKAGNTIRFTVLREDDEVEEIPWTVTGALRDGVLRIDLGEDSENAVVTFRRE